MGTVLLAALHIFAEYKSLVQRIVNTDYIPDLRCAVLVFNETVNRRCQYRADSCCLEMRIALSRGVAHKNTLNSMPREQLRYIRNAFDNLLWHSLLL